MCVRIHSGESQTEFDTSLPLEEQVVNADRVEIDYHPNDVQINTFLSELETIRRRGGSLSLKVKVIHNNYFEGGRISRKCSEITRDLGLNEFIKLMVLTQMEFDHRLNEIAEICSKV